MSGPVILFRQFPNQSSVLSTQQRAEQPGDEVVFQFKTEAQQRKFQSMLGSRILPLFNDENFSSLVHEMFGEGAFRGEQLNLSRANLTALTDEKKVEDVLVKSGLSFFLLVSAGGFAGQIAEVAKYLLETKDAKGKSVFDALDASARGGAKTPRTNGRIHGKDVGDLFVNTHLGEKELREQKPQDTRPAVMFATTDRNARPGPVSVSERRLLKDALNKGDVLFAFRNREEQQRFDTEVRRIYPIFSSAPFQTLVKKLFGASALTKVGSRTTVDLTRAQLTKLRDPVALAKKIQELRGGTAKDAAVEAKFISRHVRYILDTQDAAGRTVFDVLATNSPSRKPGTRHDARINGIDVEALVLNKLLGGMAPGTRGGR